MYFDQHTACCVEDPLLPGAVTSPDPPERSCKAGLLPGGQPYKCRSHIIHLQRIRFFFTRQYIKLLESKTIPNVPPFNNADILPIRWLHIICADFFPASSNQIVLNNYRNLKNLLYTYSFCIKNYLFNEIISQFIYKKVESPSSVALSGSNFLYNHPISSYKKP